MYHRKWKENGNLSVGNVTGRIPILIWNELIIFDEICQNCKINMDFLIDNENCSLAISRTLWVLILSDNLSIFPTYNWCGFDGSIRLQDIHLLDLMTSLHSLRFLDVSNLSTWWINSHLYWQFIEIFLTTEWRPLRGGGKQRNYDRNC